MALTRKGTGIGYAIAGIAVSGFGVLLGIVYMLMIGGMAQGLNEFAAQVEREAEKRKQEASITADSPQGDLIEPNSNESNSAASGNPDAQTSQPKPKPF